MDIAGLTLAEISQRLIPYLEEYFGGSKLAADESGIFAESYLLGYDEISWILPPDKKCSAMDRSGDYNGAAGVLNFSHRTEDIENMEYTALLLSNADYSRALLFCLQIEDKASGKTAIKIIKDFISA